MLDPELAAPCVAEAAARLSGAREQFTAQLLALFAEEIRPLQHDDELLGLLRASTDENVLAGLHMLEHGMQAQDLGAPAAALQYARRLAQRGIPLSALLRSYRLGQARFQEAAFRAVTETAGDDPVLLANAAVLLSQMVNGYIDRVSELVVVTYEAELESWQSNRSAVRAARVRSLLESERVDVSATEAKLGYRLLQDHVAMVLWLEGEQASGGDQLLRLERLAAALAASFGEAQPLFVPTDEAGAVLWVRATATPPAPDRLTEVVQASGLPARLAVGSTGYGVEGFRSSHRQAQQAKAVALASATGRTVTTWTGTGPVALLCQDLPATRSWVADTLGALAVDDEGSARLRQTLLVFLRAGCSYTGAAEVLRMHKNSVQYRVQKAEQLRGRTVRDERLDVELALRVCDALGATVLLPAR